MFRFCLSLSLFFFFNQTSEFISVSTIDLIYCTFDFPCKKEDLYQRCVEAAIITSKSLMLRLDPVLQSAFLSVFFFFFKSWTLYSNVNNTLAS